LALNAQSTYLLGVLPTVNLNKKLPKDWSLNFKAESRQSLIKGNDFQYEYLLTDLALVAGRKVGINTTVAGGYLIRIGQGKFFNRAIQQLTYVKRYSNFNLSHRVLTDQTFMKGEAPVYRFRYRLSSEIPLEGQSVDPKEFFLKISNEYLNSFQKKDYDLEIRAGGFLGYEFSPSTKIELGLDYRLVLFLNDNAINRFWIGVNFYQAI